MAELNIDSFSKVISNDFEEIEKRKASQDKDEKSLSTALEAVKGQDSLKDIAQGIESKLTTIKEQKDGIKKVNLAKNEMIDSFRKAYDNFSKVKKEVFGLASTSDSSSATPITNPVPPKSEEDSGQDLDADLSDFK